MSANPETLSELTPENTESSIASSSEVSAVPSALEAFEPVEQALGNNPLLTAWFVFSSMLASIEPQEKFSSEFEYVNKSGVKLSSHGDQIKQKFEKRHEIRYSRFETEQRRAEREAVNDWLTENIPFPSYLKEEHFLALLPPYLLEQRSAVFNENNAIKEAIKSAYDYFAYKHSYLRDKPPSYSKVRLFSQWYEHNGLEAVSLYNYFFKVFNQQVKLSMAQEDVLSVFFYKLFADIFLETRDFYKDEYDAVNGDVNTNTARAMFLCLLLGIGFIVLAQFVPSLAFWAVLSSPAKDFVILGFALGALCLPQIIEITKYLVKAIGSLFLLNLKTRPETTEDLYQKLVDSIDEKYLRDAEPVVVKFFKKHSKQQVDAGQMTEEQVEARAKKFYSASCQLFKNPRSMYFHFFNAQRESLSEEVLEAKQKAEREAAWEAQKKPSSSK